MNKKIVRYLILVFVIGCSFYPVESHSKNISEEDQLIRVGTGAFKDGFYDIAEKQFSNFIKHYPKHDRVFDIYYFLGRTLFIKGKFKEAKGIFSKILNEGKYFENMDYVLLGIAELEMRLGNDEEAAKKLLSLIRNFPKFEEIDYSYYLLGLLQLKSNQFTAAETTFQKVSQIGRASCRERV